MRDVVVILGVAVAITFFMALPSDAVLQSSPDVTFNVTQDTIRLNWTAVDTPNAYEVNITIAVNSSNPLSSSNFRAAVQNQSHTVFTNYSQPIGVATWIRPNSDTLADFGFAVADCGSGSARTPLQVKNASSIRPNETQNLNNNSNENLTVFFTANRTCAPGRYFGLLNVTNATNTTQFVNVTVVIDVPIDRDNTVSTSGARAGIGQYRGTLDATETEEHRYYFNTSSIVNATSVRVNLTWSGSADVDIFLFDQSGRFLERSNAHGSASESLFFIYPPSNQMFSVRVYGNSTSAIEYQSPGGFVTFGTLNASNASDRGQKYALIDLGTLAASDLRVINVTLENVGLVNQTNVTESKELYSLQRFSDNAPAGAKNYSLRVPDFITNIDVRLNWTGATNYTLRLIKPDGTLVGVSNNKSAIANKTGANQEEFVKFSPSGGSVGFTDDGVWTVEVSNNTGPADRYNVTAKLFLSVSSWITSNYSTRYFNQTGLFNNSATHQVNLTVQNATLSGDLEGSLSYVSGSGAIISIPLRGTVSTAELLVNGTFNKTTIELKENVGFNKTGANSIKLNITVNNTGNAALTFDPSAKSSGLNHTSTPGNFLNFTIYEPSSSISAGGADWLNVTISPNTSETGNTEGVYEGWIFLNDTASRPYTGFNLTLKVNMTKELDVFVRDVVTNDSDADIEDPGNAINFTVAAEVFFKNGTEITDFQNVSNFSVQLIEQNTSNRIPSSGSFALMNSTLGQVPDSLFIEGRGRYEINATWSADANAPGGYYKVFVGATDIRTGLSLSGNGTNSTLRVNNTGLWLKAVTSTSISVADNSETFFNLTVKNLGTLKPGGTLNMSTTSIATITAHDQNSSAGDKQCAENTPSGNGFKFDKGADADTIQPEGTEECWFRFKIKPTNVTSTQTATLTVSSQGGDVDFGDLSVSLTVTDSDKKEEAKKDEGGAGDAKNETEEEEEEEEVEEGPLFNITSYPENVDVVQGANKSVTVDVKNNDNETQSNVTLTVTGISSSWFSVTPTGADIEAEATETYTVTYTVPADAEIKVYDITYKASNPNGETSVDAKLAVQPSNETKTAIERAFAEKSQNTTALENRLKELAQQGYNITEANKTLTTLKEKLRQAGEAITQGDYIRANTLLAEADALLTQLQQQLAAAAQVAAGGGLLIWVIVGAVVAGVGGLVVYMFLPPPKETYTVAGFKYRPPGFGSPVERAKIRLKGLVEKIKSRLRRKPKAQQPVYDYTRRGGSWT